MFGSNSENQTKTFIQSLKIYSACSFYQCCAVRAVLITPRLISVGKLRVLCVFRAPPVGQIEFIKYMHSIIQSTFTTPNRIGIKLCVVMEKFRKIFTSHIITNNNTLTLY